MAFLTWPIQFADVEAAHSRISGYLPETPLRHYAVLDELVGCGIRVWVKHENHNPTNAFKVRNGLSALTGMRELERRRGVVAATRGNHGLGLAWAGRTLGVPVTICVPVGNNPEKNADIRSLGATLIESGLDYDESVDIARDVERRTGARLIHSTDDRLVIAGAATMTLAMLRQCETPLDALVLSIGGGSQAVGALTVSRHLQPTLEIFGVQAAQAPTICDSWRARAVLPGRLAETFADGLATRNVYEMTFGTLVEGLADFVTVSDAEIAAAIRALLRTTHNLAEGAGAAGLAGLIKLRERLAGRTVGIVLSGSNIDEATLRQVVTGAY